LYAELQHFIGLFPTAGTVKKKQTARTKVADSKKN
jgi:hypothetical protein